LRGHNAFWIKKGPDIIGTHNANTDVNLKFRLRFRSLGELAGITKVPREPPWSNGYPPKKIFLYDLTDGLFSAKLLVRKVKQ
jgi:hypothetical protein